MFDSGPFLISLQRYLHGNSKRSRRYLWDRLAFRIGKWWLIRTVDRRFGGYLTPWAIIGERMRLQHDLHGVFISDRAKIGDDVHILHHVTIGINFRNGRPREAPVIGNNVFIGAGATIIGGCVIGNGAKIGANVTLVDTVVPPGHVIVNNSAIDVTAKLPARLLHTRRLRLVQAKIPGAALA
jgi:serine acetyltransferase